MTDQTTVSQSNKRPTNYHEGRNMDKAHVRGKIYGRINVGLCEAEWRYVVELARGADTTLSDVIRWAIESDRKAVEEKVFGSDLPPWNKETVLAQRFAHVEITDHE